MELYRSPMEKILKEAEDGLVITNPNNRGRALRHKIVYRWACWKDRATRLFSRRSRSHTPINK